MRYNDDQLNSIYDRTGARCHICWKSLAFRNYGRPGRHAAWEVDHSRSRARGGSDSAQNLFAACVPCNREKSADSSRTARARNGRRLAPLSRRSCERARSEQAASGAVVGALLGMRFGIVGLIGGALIGAATSSRIDSESLR